MEETRSTLLRRVRDAGDQAAWAEFVRIYQPVLFSYLRSRGVQEEDAHDLVQNILISLLRNLPKFELDRQKGRFRTWLYQVTTRATIDWARKRQRIARTEQEKQKLFKEEESNEPDETWNQTVQQRLMQVAMERVKERSQPNTWRCFEEHIVKGRSGADVGAEVGMPPNTVYVNAARILERIKAEVRLLEEEQDDA